MQIKSPRRILIPAKGTSLRIPRKNMQTISGDKSLLQWTIENYRRWFPLTPIHVATDDAETKRLAVSLGCELYGLSREDLNDTRNGTDLLVEFLSVYPERPVLLAQCTSPVTFEADIRSALESDRPVSWSGHIKVLHTPETGETLSQDIEPTAVITGNFILICDDRVDPSTWRNRECIANINWLSQIDIDTEDNLRTARFLASRISQTDLDEFPQQRES